MADYASLLKSGTFVFEVGQQPERFVIHKQVVEENSPVLSSLMNNGAMQESTSGVAQLTETDSRTFTLFSEYAYTGIYRIQKPPRDEQSRQYGITCGTCNRHQTITSKPSSLPKNCPQCWAMFVTIEDLTDLRIVWQNGPKRQSRHQRSRSPSFANGFFEGGQGTQPSSAEISFKNMTYPALGRTHDVLKQYLASLQPADLPTQHVCAHAKLYVFAERYMVDVLKELCLHKLHRDLCEFSITSTNVSEIEELILYSYDNTATSRFNDENYQNLSPSSLPLNKGHDLRSLVMSYAVANAKKLMSFPSFEEIINEGGEIVLDFTKGLARRLAES